MEINRKKKALVAMEMNTIRQSIVRDFKTEDQKRRSQTTDENRRFDNRQRRKETTSLVRTCAKNGRK
jgi:hypothetical protein